MFHGWKQALKNSFRALLHTIWPTYHNICGGGGGGGGGGGAELLVPKLNKSQNERGSNPFVQVHRRSLGVFLKFFNFVEVKPIIIRGGREMEQLWVDVEYS